MEGKNNQIKEGKVAKDELERLNAIQERIGKDIPIRIEVRGKIFKVKEPNRIVKDKVMRLGFNVKNDIKIAMNADAKAAAYILLHNPLKVFLFGKIYTFILKWKYDGETFSKIITTAFDNKENDYFLKSSISIINQGQVRMAMMQIS